MVDAQKRLVERYGQGAGGGGHGSQARPQAGSAGEGDHIKVGEAYASGLGGLLDEGHHDVRVMVRRLPGMDASLLRAIHVHLVGQDVGVLVDDSHAAGVGGAFDSKRKHWW